jgi:hypothetical protein
MPNVMYNSQPEDRVSRKDGKAPETPKIFIPCIPVESLALELFRDVRLFERDLRTLAIICSKVF